MLASLKGILIAIAMSNGLVGNWTSANAGATLFYIDRTSLAVVPGHVSIKIELDFPNAPSVSTNLEQRVQLTLDIDCRSWRVRNTEADFFDARGKWLKTQADQDFYFAIQPDTPQAVVAKAYCH